MTRSCRVRDIEIGPGKPLAIIAGPCTLESLDMGLAIGRAMKAACDDLGLPYIFKASFDKANRTSAGSPRGPGLEDGLAQFAKIKSELGCPATTDIHAPDQARAAGEVIDLLQIPAFLCRQSDLLEAAGEVAAKTGAGVNVKKGQFLSPKEMAGPVRKLAEVGCDNVMLTDRGTFFGYHRLVNDFTGLGDLLDPEHAGEFAPDYKADPPPVCFDATHSTQLPGSGAQTGGRRERSALLARAAVAAGVHALFIEAHPDPDTAWSDGATQLTPDAAIEVIRDCAAIHQTLNA